MPGWVTEDDLEDYSKHLEAIIFFDSSHSWLMKLLYYVILKYLKTCDGWMPCLVSDSASGHKVLRQLKPWQSLGCAL